MEDECAAEAEQAVIITMTNLPSLGRRRPKELKRETVIPHAAADLLKMATRSGRPLSRSQALEEVERAVERLVEKGDIEAPAHGTWKRVRV